MPGGGKGKTETGRGGEKNGKKKTEGCGGGLGLGRDKEKLAQTGKTIQEEEKWVAYGQKKKKEKRIIHPV